jgi:hypothetical protein
VSAVPVARRGTGFWLEALRRRAHKLDDAELRLDEPILWESERERAAAIRFFNAAFRAEESGLRQAHELAIDVDRWDPELGEVLRLYGEEEGWHRQLLERFLGTIGGGVQPMGRVTRFLYRAYGRARRMETIVLTNLLFETIGATTYRMALANVKHPTARRILTVLTRDESFHVPLNAHFLATVLARKPDALRRARLVYRLAFVGLVLLPWASRPKAEDFDRIPALSLARAYAEELHALFADRPELDFRSPRLLMALLGARRTPGESHIAATSLAAAEASVDRESVQVAARSPR